jgi:ERCC4-type nuclease
VVEINDLGFHYRFTDKELKQLLQSITVLVDTSEQQNQHILKYFDSKKIHYKSIKLEVADYSVMLPACPELGIIKDIHLPIAIERKNSVNELVQTFKDRTRFENELIRSQKIRFSLLVEDQNGYENLIRGNYRSQYNAKALVGTLKSFETRYGFFTAYIPNHASGHYI